MESRDLIVLIVILTLACVPDNLSSKLVALVMDPSLVENVEVLSSSRGKILIRYSNL